MRVLCQLGFLSSCAYVLAVRHRTSAAFLKGDKKRAGGSGDGPWAVEHSQVRLQWDPDHDPAGAKVERRAIQLGLRGEMLAQYAREWVIGIEDISDFVSEQHQQVQAHAYEQLMTPRELVYPVADVAVASRLGLTIS